MCDIYFCGDEVTCIGGKHASIYYYKQYVENVRPLFKKEICELKYIISPFSVCDDIFANHIKPFMLTPENEELFYYQPTFIIKNVKVKCVKSDSFYNPPRLVFLIVDAIVSTRKLRYFYYNFNTPMCEHYRSYSERMAAFERDEDSAIYRRYKNRQKTYEISAPYTTTQKRIIKGRYYICNIKFREDQYTTGEYFPILEDVRPCE